MLNLSAVELKSLKNRYLRLSFLDEIKVSAVLIAGLFFLSFVYWAAWRLVSYLNAIEVIGPLLVNKFLALVFLTSFSMIIFSALVTSFNTLFFSRDVSWIMTTPLSLKSIFAFKSFATAFYSSWMVLAALLPFLAAFAQVKGQGAGFYFLSSLLMIPFLLMASFAGIMATLFLMRLFPSKGVRDVFIFLGVFLLAGLYILFRFMQPERLVRPDGLEVISHYLSYLEAPTASYLPSWWVTAGMYSAVSGKIPAFLGYLSLLCASAGFLLWLLLLAADKVYFAGWTQGSIISRRKALKKHLFGAVSGLSALFKKDRLTFFRNTGEWTQLLVLGAIVVVYLFSIYKVPLDTLYLQNLLSYVNIALIGFILSAVALRLVFPSISIEGRNMWLLFSSPLGRAKLYWSKLLFGILPVLIMGMVLVILSNLLLKADYTVFWMTTEAVVIMSIGLPCMATAFGSAFPRFDLENTAQIESSLGGIFYIITALFYIAVNMSLWSMPVQNYYRVKFMMRHLPSGYFYKIYAVILIFNLFVFVFCTWFGIKRLKKMEI